MEAFRQRSRRLANFVASDDTKREFLTSPQSRPDLEALQNEATYQRERLQRWLTQWKEECAAEATAPVTEEVAQERLAIQETQVQVLDNISKILEEAGQIQPDESETTFSPGPQKDVKVTPRADKRWTAADRTKFAELASDLKNSIDLLYELLNTRKSIREGTYPMMGKGKSDMTQSVGSSMKGVFAAGFQNESQETLVNPSRTGTTKTMSSLELPSRLDPSLLEIPEETPAPYDSMTITSTRTIAYLRQPAPPSRSGAADNGTVSVPVLIEYAPFDEAYRVTGVAPSYDRLHQLMNYYGRCGAFAEYAANAMLPCLGFFEDTQKPRVALVYELPKFVTGDLSHQVNREDYQPMSLLQLLQSASKELNSKRLIAYGPALEDRYRLAFNVLQAFSRMHVQERMIHKDVNSDNVLFFKNRTSPNAQPEKSEYDLRTPFVMSFDLFTEYSLEKAQTDPSRNLYRHPDDPRSSADKCKECQAPECRCSKVRFDLYGLALILIEIGMWVPTSDLFKPQYTLRDFRERVERIWLKKLPTRMGNLYTNLVRDILFASDEDRSEAALFALYDKCFQRIQRCLIIDDEEDGSSLESSPSASMKFSNPQLRSQVPAPLYQSSYQTYMGPQFPSLSTISAFTRPLTRLVSRRAAVPRSVPESSDESELSLQVTPQSSFGIQEEDFAKETFKYDDDATSIDYATSRYQKAAKTIQRAWRSKCTKPAFTEYKRKVTVIQRQWRKRRHQQRSHDRGTAQSLHPPGYIEEVRMEDHHIMHNSSITISPYVPQRPKLRIFPQKLQPEILDQWECHLLPRLEKIITRALRDSDEPASIDLVSLGETALTTKPTIMVTCTSTQKVKRILDHKFKYDHVDFDLKVRKGKIRRSKVDRTNQSRPPHRSMVNDGAPSGTPPLNPFHQQRPLCGASIGAFVGKHLPPVSYGGVVNIDDEVYGMTVHHLLDAPSDDDESEYFDDTTVGASRSSARTRNSNPWATTTGSQPSLQSIPTDSIFPLEISDDDFETSDQEAEIEYSDDGYSSSEDELFSSVASDSTAGTQGDLAGIFPGVKSQIPITQPAIDDVDDDFFPNYDDREEDHMDSHELGHVHASSGIRRWTRRGICHEIDWALIKVGKDRLQPFNLVQGGKRFFNDAGKTFRPQLQEPVCRGQFQADEDEYPYQIARVDELANLSVHCFGRTSGLQGGRVGPAMSSVRIYRRRSFSRSWHVIGGFGMGGDSGAWVIDDEQGRVCGHVLAWCERNGIAYICPMEVLLEDIKRTLGAQRICLPGGVDLTELRINGEEGDRAASFIRGKGTSLTEEDRNDSKMLEEKAAVREELPNIGKLDFGENRKPGLPTTPPKLQREDSVKSGLGLGVGLRPRAVVEPARRRGFA